MSQIDVVSSKEFQDRRRSEPRVMCERTISLVPCGGDDTKHFLTAHLTDCSPHGLGLFLPQNVPAGQQVLVRMQVDRQPTLLMYTIRYCIPTKANQFRAGARFTGFAASQFRGDMKAAMAFLSGGG